MLCRAEHSERYCTVLYLTAPQRNDCTVSAKRVISRMARCANRLYFTVLQTLCGHAF